MVKRLEKVPTQDAIAESIEQNAAGRNEDLIGLVRILDSIEGPYSLLLDAQWGDGKTFFVKSLVEVLKVLNSNINNDQKITSSLKSVTDELKNVETLFLPFYFNAWENDFEEDPISALFANMAIAFDEMGLTKERSLQKCIVSVVDTSLSAIHVLPRGVSKISEAFAGESLIKAYGERVLLRERISELAEKSIREVANKLVIIIDELDRCRPDFAVRLLEQTKSLFQSDNIIVIISTDSLQLAHAIAGLYGPDIDSQHFIERFFDSRLTLTPADACKVITGEPQHSTSHTYDLLRRELSNAHNLAIRDYARLHEKLEAGRAYCDMNDDGTVASSVAKCLFIPLLIFIQGKDIELFRAITGGSNYDALYEYGSKYSAFNNHLNRAVVFGKTGQRWNGKDEVSEEDRRQYVHGICVWLFSPNRSSQEYNESFDRVGMPSGLDRSVFTTLRFPEGN